MRSSQNNLNIKLQICLETDSRSNRSMTMITNQRRTRSIFDRVLRV